MRHLAFLSLLLVPAQLFAASELRLDRTRESLLGTHYHYQQYIDGVEVVGGEATKSIDARGVVYAHAERIAREPAPRTRETSADSVATLAVPGRERERRQVYLNIDGEARLVWRVVAQERALEPYAHYFDAATGELLRSEALFFNVQGRVFEVNPVARLNDPSLQDQNNAAAAVPDSAYSIVELPGLGASGPLANENVQIVDLEAPHPNPADASQSLLFDRSDPRFEEVNAYYHVDHVQRYLQSLGYEGSRRLVAYPIPVDAHAANGTDNSYYISAIVAGQGALYFGDGGTDDAEDPDIMIHEFGHAIQDWIAPAAFLGPSASQARALSEGFGDYWSFSQNYAGTVVSGRDPFCFADWDARCFNDDPSQNCGYRNGSDCLRRVDSSKTMRDFVVSDSPGTEHLNGMIWSSALREIFMALTAKLGSEQGKRLADTLVLEGTFGVPPNPTFAVMGRRLLDADRLLTGGANGTVICSAMTLRSILTTSDCDRSPHGELTYVQSPEHGIAIPDINATGITSRVVVADTRVIDKLYVSVDISHTSRGDLQLTLVGPDGTSVILQNASLDRAADIHATYGLDAQPAQSLDAFSGKPANGEWKLVVVDLHPRDVGTLTNWSLVIQFAGDAPSATRPALVAPQVIPVAGHTPGANGTFFETDLSIYNSASSAREATLIFTPSGAAGASSFCAVKVAVEAGHVVTFDDVVLTMFQNVGTGQIAITGDGDLHVTSRTYTVTDHGTLGEAIPTEVASKLASSRSVAGLRSDASFRSNYGLTDLGGTGGTVSISIIEEDQSFVVETREIVLAPFEHVQLPVTATGAHLRVDMDVETLGASIFLYGSLIDNRSGDSTYMRGESEELLPLSPRVVPVAHAPGAGGTAWQSDVSLVHRFPGSLVVSFPDTSLPQLRLEPNGSASIDDAGSQAPAPLYPLVIFSLGNGGTNNPPPLVFSRTWTAGASGSYGQGISGYPATSAITRTLGNVSTVFPAESSPSFRTNIGLMEIGKQSALVRLTLRDAEGSVVGSQDVVVPPRALVQLPLSRIAGTAEVRSGRVSAEIVDGNGQIIMYESIVDNQSQDPEFIWSQIP